MTRAISRTTIVRSRTELRDWVGLGVDVRARGGRWWSLGLACVLLLSSADGVAAQDLARLLAPEVAAQVGLDDAQRAAVQRLVQQRADEVAAAPDDRDAIAQRFQESVRALLTEEQWTRFQAGPNVSAPLRFNFNEQPWSEVLRWFAAQADASLVMDDVPTGTFTYADQRTYSPPEAIDLINSVLLTRGYTIVRREKMMTVVKLGEALPLELIPRVKLEELPSRGRFEMVSVEFEVGARPMDAVVTEVTPYLGPFGRAVPLAQARRIIVVEAAGKMETINVLIASVPLPKPPDKPVPPPEPPKPVFATYTLGELDAQATLETLQGLVGGGDRLTVDNKTRLLSAFVTPDQHTAIQSYLTEMIAKQTARGPLRLAIFQPEAGTGEALVAQVTASIPGVTVSLDKTSGRLLVTGDDASLQATRDLLAPLGIEELGGAAPQGEGERRLSVYDVAPTQVASLSTLLEDLMPRARIVGDATQGRLAIDATAEEHQRISEFLEQMRAMSAERAPTVRRLAIPAGLSATDLTSLAGLVPEVTATRDAKGDAVLVSGPTQGVERFAKLLEEWKASTVVPAEPTLREYEVRPEILARLQKVREALPESFRGLREVDASKPGRWSILADETVHTAISTWIERLETENPLVERKLQRYAIEAQRRPLVERWLSENARQAEKLPVEEAGVLLLSATDEEHAELTAWLAALDTQWPTRQTEVRSYSVTEERRPLVTAWLTEQTPEAKLLPFEDERVLLLSASPEDHTSLGEWLKTLDTQLPPESEEVLVAYPLQHVEATGLTALLTKLIGDDDFVIDSTGRQVVVVATLERQARIKAALEQLDRPEAEAAEEVLQSYDLGGLTGTTVMTMFTPMWPKMRLTVDATTGKLLAWGTRLEQQELAATLAELTSGQGAGDRELQVFAIEAGDVTTLPTILRQIAPGALLSVDATSRTLSVWGTAAERARVEKAISELGSVSQERQELEIHPVAKERATTMVTTLATLFPTTRVALGDRGDRIVALGPAADQERIRAILQRTAEGEAEGSGRVLQVYRLGTMTAVAFESLLGRIAPEATTIVVGTVGPAAVWATEEEHVEIKKAMTEIDAGANGATDMSLRTYRLPRDQAATFPTLLLRIRPTATLASGAGTDSVVVADTEAGHAILSDWVASMEAAAGAGTEPSLRSHVVRVDLKAGVTAGITAIEPKVLFVPSGRDDTVLAWATEEQHQTIENAIRKLEQEVQAPAERKLARHPLLQVERTRVLEVLEASLPDLEVVPTSRIDELVAWGTDQEHAKVDEIVKQLGEMGLTAASLTTRVISWKVPTLTSAAVAQALEGALPAGVELRPLAAAPAVVVVGPDDVVLAQVEKKVTEVVAALPGGETLETRAFPLKHVDPTATASVLKAMLPLRAVAAEPESKQVALTGTREELERITNFLAGFDVPSTEGDRETRLYRVKRGSARGLGFSLSEMLPDATIFGDRETNLLVATATPDEHLKIAAVIEQLESLGESEARVTRVFSLTRGDAGDIEDAIQAIAEQASVSADGPTNTLIVSASAEEMAKIESVVKQIEEGRADALVTKAYAVERGDPSSLRSALQPLLTGARITADDESGILLVTGSEEDHVQVARVIEDLAASSGREPRLKAYSLKFADAETVAESIEDSIPRSRSVGIGFDSATSSVFVVAPPEQQETVAEMIQMMDREPAETRDRELKVHSLFGVDGDAVANAVDALFDGVRPAVDVSYDDTNRQLVVVGSRAQQTQVEETIRQFAIPERQFELFELRRNEPASVQSAISQLFADDSIGSRPTVSVDDAGGQLIVRGTAEQMTRIRELLIRLGESVEATESGIPSGGARIRHLPASARFEDALRRVQEVWPTIRGNRIEVLGGMESKKESAEKPRSEEGETDQPEVQEKLPKSSTKSVLMQEPAAPPSAGLPPEDSQQPAPILVIPDAEGWTLASDDVEALGQFESLLRAAMSRGTAVAMAGSFSVHLLEHAGAGDVAELLNDLYRRVGTATRTTSTLGRVAIVADERINALVVHASRSDREIIEELLAVMDSEELMEKLQTPVPQLLSIEHANVERVESIIRNVYRSQLASGGGRRPVPIPDGVSPEIASVLQQINAAASGPLLTVDGDAESNSLIVRGPDELVDEIRTFVRRLDDQSLLDRGTRINVIQLQGTNGERMEEALRTLMGGGGGAGRRGR